jgi:hypothetical protein
MESKTENSWAEMVKSIEKNKRELSWNPAEVLPVQRVSNFEVPALLHTTI